MERMNMIKKDSFSQGRKRRHFLKIKKKKYFYINTTDYVAVGGVDVKIFLRKLFRQLLNFFKNFYKNVFKTIKTKEFLNI
jgi:hypothetical protein